MMRLTFRFTRLTAGSSMNRRASDGERQPEPPAGILDLRVADRVVSTRAGGIEDRLGVRRHLLEHLRVRRDALRPRADLAADALQNRPRLRARKGPIMSPTISCR